MLRSLKQRGFIGLLVFILSLSLTSLVYAQGETAALGVFDAVQVAPGSVVQVPVSIRNVQGLYGLDFTLEFNPALVQVKDADSSVPGIQASLGSFLDPGLLLFNNADNEKGIYHFVMSQYNPSEAKSGGGVILVISFIGVAEGESPLTLTDIQLADRAGIDIPSEAVNSTLTVRASAPTQAVTFPVVESTGLILIQTFTPTPTPTEISTGELATPLSVKSAIDSPTAVATTMNENSNAPDYFLVQNWWVVLILLVILIAIGIYFFRLKKNS